VITLLFSVAAVAWLVWAVRFSLGRNTLPELLVMAAAGGALTAAAPNSGAGAFVFIAAVAAGLRSELPRAAVVVAVGSIGLAIAVLVYKTGALGFLAYSLGFAATLLGASTSRQVAARAEQAELLLAQTQRSHEEQLRATRLEESTRIAREIHDVLAHALAGLTIQLDATRALIEQGTDRDALLARVDRARELAREGLQETRRAVGALRGERPDVRSAIEELVADYDAAPVQLTIDGDARHLDGAAGDAVRRVVQEALTNVRKHAPGAEVSVSVHAGEDAVVVVVADHAHGAPAQPLSSELAASGGGFGVRGMRERAESLGGTLSAGPVDGGWRVEMRFPTTAGART
jgi:signal transduction histidine kinase